MREASHRLRFADRRFLIPYVRKCPVCFSDLNWTLKPSLAHSHQKGHCLAQRHSPAGWWKVQRRGVLGFSAARCTGLSLRPCATHLSCPTSHPVHHLVLPWTIAVVTSCTSHNWAAPVLSCTLYLWFLPLGFSDGWCPASVRTSSHSGAWACLEVSDKGYPEVTYDPWGTGKYMFPSVPVLLTEPKMCSIGI